MNTMTPTQPRDVTDDDWPVVALFAAMDEAATRLDLDEETRAAIADGTADMAHLIVVQHADGIAIGPFIERGRQLVADMAPDDLRRLTERVEQGQGRED